MISSALFTLAAASMAAAHGIVSTITTSDGGSWDSPAIGASGSTGPFYLVSDSNPITDVSSDNMFCGPVATEADETPSVAAGSTMSFFWKSGYGTSQSNWPHNTGPGWLYMAKCDADDCSSAAAGTTKFAKVGQLGFEGSTWAQAALKDGKAMTFTVPSDIEEGTYMFRHEVLNLASVAEFYPSCSRFKVTGGGSTSLDSADTAAFPGAYDAASEGLRVAGSAVYSITSNAEYDFPGPAVFGDGSSSTGGDSGSNNGSSGSSGSGSASGPASSSAAAPSGVASSSPVGGAVSSAASSGAASSAGAPAPTGASGPSTAAGSAGGAPSTPAATSASTPAASGSSSGGDSECSSQWDACQAKYTGSAEDQASYNCQTSYVTCLQARATGLKMRRHRRSTHH
ncbi:lytic polysaccharide monooxygenase [Cylindrobasidium torrendii FP15055 ss-10]|uniref:lytic cellulose monooxygenase (C4-dehydrogenating) n=1 Tax=Cylindrobasidium torrendii FP15055 ss-10 TaxID=1314674 RepID=A0A0D7BJA9_9AGAR|nr:lytic polysaccharide monooxygenase [Cylindrobasidium torrendii FP15055 ss-10]